MTTNTSLLTTKEAAKYLGLQASTLRNARCSGRLAGVAAPRYKKIGTAVRYTQNDLDSWLDQFETKTCEGTSIKILRGNKA